MTDSERHRLQHVCDALLSQQQTLQLATLSAQGKPDISYAPYVHANGNFYIFISELARHTQNLLIHPQASVLIIEAEANASNPFARKRLTTDCEVCEVVKADVAYKQIMQAFELKFGDIVAVLKGLPDFHLFCLQPLGGHVVAGFGKALAVDTLLHVQSAVLLANKGVEDTDVEE